MWLVAVLVIAYTMVYKSKSIGFVVAGGAIIVIITLLFAFMVDAGKIEPNYCPTCEKSFSLKYDFCPFDGTELIEENVKENKKNEKVK